MSFALVSPFPSEVEGLNIPNSHIIEESKGTLIRGMRPRTEKDISELLELGVTDVLIFKNSNATDKSTEEEITALEKAGISRKNIRVIPFKWKGIESFESACLQTLEALNYMREVAKDKNRKLFFHCTVGEDRTGYLAGMYEILYKEKTFTKVWKNQMCENGYADGNPRKPKEVVAEVHKNVTDLFQKMNHKINHGYLSATNLDPIECSFDPSRSKRFKVKYKNLKCEPSSKYDPTIE